MANIETLTNLDRTVRRKFKKVFEKLSDAYFVRESILEEAKIAPIIIEGPCNSWLFLGSHSVQPTFNALRKHIDFNQALISMGFHEIKYLAIVEQAPSLFDQENDLPNFVETIELNEFIDSGADVVNRYLIEVSIMQYNWIKKTLFSESVIHSQCTTRRKATNRDNSSSLQEFFLDYDQEQATKFDMFESSSDEELEDNFSVRLINGVAGSGKTLILINRAILFCKKYPEKNALLIIHNKPVTSDVTYRIEKWLGGKPKNLTIQTFHAFALGQRNRLSNRIKPLFNVKDLKLHKEKILTDDNDSYKNLNLSDEQIWTEIEYINDYLIESENDYLEYERHGRGFALQKPQRSDVWGLYQLTVEAMSLSTGYLPSLYIREMCLMKDTSGLKKFDHVLIDEAQF
ncbi:MAG: hypothetical protein RPT25_01635 [Cycloclasticus sp.]